MKQSSAGKLLPPRILVISWYFTAVLTRGSLIVSLPGYFAWYVQQPISQRFTGPQVLLAIASGLASLLCAVTCLGLGTFLFKRKAGDQVALFISFYLLLYGVLNSGPLEMIEFLISHQPGLISAHVQVILFTAPTLVLMLTFPNGIITPARFRWLIPFGVLVSLMEALAIFIGLGAQVYRYFWKSSPVERQQTKIVFFGLWIQILLLWASGIIYFQIPEDIKNTLTPDNLIGNFFWLFSLIILPISFTLA
jgi:hypothetical protein